MTEFYKELKDELFMGTLEGEPGPCSKASPLFPHSSFLISAAPLHSSALPHRLLLLEHLSRSEFCKMQISFYARGELFYVCFKSQMQVLDYKL